MKKLTTLLDDVLKISALFSIVLIITGFVDLRIHFGYFGVNISHFINASEILVESFDNILIVLLLLLIQLEIWLVFFNYLFDYTEEDIRKGWKPGERRPQKGDDETIRRFLRTKILLGMLLLIFGLFMILVFAKVALPRLKILSQISIFVSVNCWIVMLIYFGGLQVTRKLWTLANKQIEYHPKFLVSFVVFFPILLLSTWLNSNLSANHIRRYGNDIKLEILLNDNSKIVPNDTIRYIGRTENYFFFWNKNTGTSTIYPNSDVKQIINYK